MFLSRWSWSSRLVLQRCRTSIFSSSSVSNSTFSRIGQQQIICLGRVIHIGRNNYTVHQQIYNIQISSETSIYSTRVYILYLSDLLVQQHVDTTATKTTAAYYYSIRYTHTLSIHKKYTIDWSVDSHTLWFTSHMCCRDQKEIWFDAENVCVSIRSSLCYRCATSVWQCQTNEKCAYKTWTKNRIDH